MTLWVGAAYLRKESEPGKDFGATVALITTTDVDLIIVLEEDESGDIGFYSSLPPDPL